MKSEFLEPTINKAITALNATPAREIQQLSVAACAMALELVAGSDQLAGIVQLLAERLRPQLTSSWIEQEDLYTVFAVMTTLWKYDSFQVTGEQLACAINRLVASEVTVGGPYYSGRQICPAANAQIALFVRQVAKPLPNIEAFLRESIVARRFENTRLTTTGLLYLLTLASDNPTLRRYITGEWPTTTPPTPQNQAVILHSLQKKPMTAEVQQTLARLCQQQQASGFWDGEPLVTKPSSGSRFLTTALIIKTLLFYQRRLTKRPPSAAKQGHQAIEQAAQQLFSNYREPLRSSALLMINQLCNKTKNFEITILPQLFSEGLRVRPPLAQHHYTTLGLASLCGWMAYTIYDDFLDNEGSPAQLPLANVAMRHSLDYFKAATAHQSSFMPYVAQTFSRMDEANAWEVAHCRFQIRGSYISIQQLPRYGNGRQLAARSFANALAPLIVLTHPPKADPRQLQQIEAAFRHYLIARQLHDDLHDWVEDITAGRATFVVTTILRVLRLKPGNYELASLIPLMQHTFRRAVLPMIGERILKHIATSKKYFVNSQLLQRTNIVYSLLDNLKLSAQQALDKQHKAKALFDRVIG